MLGQNYLWYEAHGFEPVDEQERGEMLELLGGDAPIDLGLRGERDDRAVGPGFRVEVLHLRATRSGTSASGTPTDRVAIIIDAALGDGDLRPRRQQADPAALLRRRGATGPRSAGSARSSPSCC